MDGVCGSSRRLVGRKDSRPLPGPKTGDLGHPRDLLLHPAAERNDNSVTSLPCPVRYDFVTIRGEPQRCEKECGENDAQSEWDRSTVFGSGGRGGPGRE